MSDVARYVTAAQVCERYSASLMWITRRLAQNNFPKPVYLAGCRRWLIAELDAWDASEIAKGKPSQRDTSRARAAIGTADKKPFRRRRTGRVRQAA